jgi:hypothetical protein
MRTTDALGIGGNCQKGKDRRDAYNLEKGLRERQQKNRGKLRPAIWSRQKENAPNQISDVMDKRGQGGSELRVQKKRMILQRREFSNYLREDSGVKAYRIPSKVPLWLCRGARPGHQDQFLSASEFPQAGAISAKSCGRPATCFMANNVSHRTTGALRSGAMSSHFGATYSSAKLNRSYTKTSIGIQISGS